MLALGLSILAATSSSSARNTGIPCARTSVNQTAFDVNALATLHETSSDPPYFICLRPTEYVDKHLKKTGQWPECSLLRSLLPPPPGLFVDAGANIGACSLFMAALGYRVIAFEPTPTTFAALAAGVASNHQRHPPLDVRMVNAGLSNHSARATIFSMPNNAGNSITTGSDQKPHSLKHVFSSHYRRHDIHLTTLDEMVHEPVGLMKIDTQGHELRVLQGASRLLGGREGIPVIKLEFYPPGMRAIGDEPVELLHLLDAAGYNLEDVGGDQVGHHAAVPVARSDFQAFAQRVERKGYTDVVARRKQPPRRQL